MLSVTAKVLFFRYVYVMRQRWLLTMGYLLLPLGLCLLAATFYDSDELEKYGSPVVENDEKSLLLLPATKNCLSEGRRDCQLKIVACPDATAVRQLMDRVVEILLLSNHTWTLDISYVNHPDQMERILVSSNSNARGLHFHQITPNLNYTMRPRTDDILPLLSESGNYATDKAFPSPMYRGPVLTNPYFNLEFTLNQKTSTLVGLLPLQVAVDKAYISTYLPNISREWRLTSFPYPTYYELRQEIRFVLSHRFYLIFFQYLLIMGISFMAMVFASYIISDKSSGIREWLCLYGAPRLMVNLSWLVSFCFEATILAIIEMIVLKLPTTNGPTITYMNAVILCLVLIVYYFMTLSWVYLFASLLNNRLVCILLIAAYWFFTPILQWIPPDHFVLQGFLATLPNAGLALIFASFQEFDGAETVLGVNQLYWFPIHYLPVGILLLIMFLTSVLLVLLGMYVDLVKPGKYGRARPWYLFTKEEKMEDQGVVGRPLPNEGKYFEQFSSKGPVALECVGITKIFNKHKAVDSINMEIPKNNITVLVGHNGAGKTTLLSMLCGLYSPTKGHFRTEEYDVFQGENIEKFRRVMGYCPQYNWFMGELTVKQHFVIFGLLKGLSRKEAEQYFIGWTERFDMKKFLETRASKLSGGNKRKLCLAIAMVGDPQYLLLDEPSSSLDAESTRTFWDVLQREKDNCTIILTTHDMNEADILGDRIAFMVAGRLKGYGSSSFLKNQLKIGHKLTCSVNKKDKVKVMQVVENFDRSTAILHQTNHTVTFGFPAGKSEGIPSLMKKLESEFQNEITMSLSYASIDEVFVDVEPDIASRSPSIGGSKKHSIDDLDLLRIPETRISCWSCGLIKEIFLKKIKWTYNHKTTAIIFLVILPVIGIVLTMYSTNNAIGHGISSEDSTNLKLTMDKYSGSRGFIAKSPEGYGGNIYDNLKLSMKANGIEHDEVYGDMVEHLSKQAKKNLFVFRSRNVFAFDTGDKVSNIPTAYYSRNAFHSAPIAYSALINAMLPGDASITTRNFPVVGERKGQGEGRKEGSCARLNPTLVTILFNVILGPLLLISGSYFVMFPKIERKTLFKHLQLMAGLLPAAYWISHLMFDILIFTVSALLIIVILAIMDDNLFLNPTVLTALIIVLLLYGISVIIFAYACSFCGCSVSTIVILFVSIHPLLLITFLTLKIILLLNSIILQFGVLYFSPWMILMGALDTIALWAVERKACLECKDLGACAYISTYGLFSSLKTELLSFVVVALVYFAFIVAMDHGFGRKLGPIVDRICFNEIKDNEDDIDPDVAQEKNKVKVLEIEGGEYDYELISDGLGKKYSFKVTAVRDVTFAAERGEIFGLLGANGAGKSTTFGMLSGLIAPTKGLATVSGRWELTDCEHKYIRNIGYCPQFHGYLPGLSGRNTLHLFGRLRGFEPPFLDYHVDMWLRVLGMVSIADVPCQNFSGGNLRKLSFAIAMIGCPPVVLLDEPTANIDPVVRRRIWDILMTSMRQRNQAIILTSHAMSECETICDRLTIMVDGEMKCLGSVPKLKNYFGKSCILLVKLKYSTTDEQMDIVRSRILEGSQFSRYTQLNEEQTNLLSINVNTEKIKTYDILAEMMKIKEKNSAIEDFSLIDTPLEEVFMKFTQENRFKESSNRRRRSQRQTRGHKKV